jgi:phospholipid-binding lipoprotein MlaA
MRATIGRAAHAVLLGFALLAPPAWGDDGAPEPDPLFDEGFADEYQAELGASVPDPIEPLNRKFFAFNDQVDQLVLLPVTKAYQFVLPSPVRASIRRAFRNLQSPVHFVNNLLQLRFLDAAQTLGAFALNTTAGIGGLFDAGAEAGWAQHPADFGQTLGMYGVQSGPYLVIPLLGPSTMRDGFGDLVDRAFDPLTYLLGMGDLIFIGGSSGFVTREANAEAIEALRDSSVDYYAAMRSAFTQNRESRIAELRAHLFDDTPPPPEPTAAE